MKICLFRLSAIGDATHALTVVRQIQDQSPASDITWIIGRQEHSLLGRLEGVEFIVFDKAQGLAAMRHLLRQLRGRRFDVLLHMQVAFRANLASLAVRAERRIGYDIARAKDLHGLVINERIAAGREQHVIDALQSFLVPLGLQPGPPRWDLPLTDSDREHASMYVSSDRPTLCISAVSSHRLRNWSIKRYAAVADHAASKYGMQVLLTGGPGEFERNFNAAIEAEMQSKVIDLTGKSTLTQLAAILEHSDLVLAPDTGPGHIANAMRTDVIGLYATSNPLRSGPYHSLRWCVNRYPDAAKKFLGLSMSEVRWGRNIVRPGVMDLITVNDVTAKIDEWIAERSRGAQQQPS